LPRRGKREDLASAIWSQWRTGEEDEETEETGTPVVGRTLSEGPPREAWDAERMPGAWVRGTANPRGQQPQEGQQGTEGDGVEQRGSWGRSRGYSVV
jgi:hypothetical protein